ncbi:hypothetical protein [Adhaeribacter aquaticus]|uniref:hypothetical protein n=1 Tax=Adhaeribacter aquaticus TaxID=299567 RepID=UPI000419D804|nr:hypothetical protein [Adhaeribacter aquaticus]
MADKLILEGEEVELGEAVVALTLQANNIMSPDTIQAHYTNSIALPPTQKNRKLLGFADQVNSATGIPYKVLDARIFKDGVEVVPYGKGELLNGSFELDVYSGNRNFFNELGDKSIRDLDLSEFNHTWDYGTIKNNTTNDTWQQGFVYDLYHRGKELNLNQVDCFSLYPSVFVRQVWEKVFSEAGFTYTGFEHPMLDKMLLPLSELFEFNEEYKRARQFRVTTNATEVVEDGDDVRNGNHKLKFNFVKTGFGVDTNGGYQLNNFRYVVDTPRIMTFTAGVKVKISSLTGFLKATLEIRVNGESIGGTSFTNKIRPNPLDPTGDATRFLTVSTEAKLLKAGDIVEAYVKTEPDSLVYVISPKLWIKYQTAGTETPYFSGTVLGEFPKGGRVELAQWLPDLSQKEFIKSIVQLFGLTFQTDLFRDIIKINTFAQVVDNIPKAIDISEWVHHPEAVKPSFKFGDFAQGNKIVWQEDKTVTKGFNNGEVLIYNTTLEAEKTIIELPYAATEKLGEPLSLPMWKAKPETNPVQYDEQSIEPRLVVQGPDKIQFTILEGVVSGEIKQWGVYRVHGQGKVHYFGNEYNANEQFVGHNEPRFTTEGNVFVALAGISATVESLIAYHVDPAKEYDLNIQDYIIPTFYPTLLAILDSTKVIRVQVKTPAQFIQDFDQSVPVWVDYWQQYFYINKINEFINSHSLTEWELVRL